MEGLRIHRRYVSVGTSSRVVVLTICPGSADLDFWYEVGPGSPIGSAWGIGYVQELVARLTQTPLTVFDTTTNGTLDGNNVTFPLDQPIYMDATHDSIFASSKCWVCRMPVVREVNGWMQSPLQ